MSKTVFTFGGSKEASLYFDDVVPLLLIIDAIWDYGSDDFFSSFNPSDMPKLLGHRKLYDRIMPAQLQKGGADFDLFIDINMKILTRINEYWQSESEDGKDMNLLEVCSVCMPYSKEQIVMLSNRLRIEEPVFAADSFLSQDTDTEDEDVGITLLNLNLIDASSAPLKQIVEFREDADSVKRLRRLRLFAYDNYAGKPKSYIEDDLLLRIDDYEREAKKWGFETKEAALTTLLNSKVLLGAAGGSILAAIAGSPIASLSTLVLGTAIEIGRLQLTVSKKKFYARDSLGTNPVSYITMANEKLST